MRRGGPSERFGRVTYELAAGEASYRQGEIHRLRGECAAAERAYGEARKRGWEPQPGLCLLRLAEGNREAAAAAIRRAVGEASDASKRAALLPAYIEIMLAVGAVDDARTACRELEEIGEGFGSGMLAAALAHARGAITLGDGDAWAALVSLRHACRAWQELDVPFEAARSRALVGLACRALGDEETATLELEAARDVFARLGAAPDVARVDVARPGRRRSRVPWALATRAGGAAPGRRRSDEQGDRRIARPERADGRASPQQHLLEAAGAVASSCDRVRLRARADLSPCGWNHPREPAAKDVSFPRCRAVLAFLAWVRSHPTRRKP